MRSKVESRLTINHVPLHVFRILVVDIDHDISFTRNLKFVVFGHGPFVAVIPFDERRNHWGASRYGKLNGRIQLLDAQRYAMNEDSVERKLKN